MFKLWDIRKHMLSLVLAPTVLISVMLSVYFIQDRIDTLENAHQTKGEIIISSVAQIIETITIDDKFQLEKQFTLFRDSDRDIIAIAIMSDNNEVILSSGNDNYLNVFKSIGTPNQLKLYFEEDYLQLVKPVFLKNSPEPSYLSVLLDRNPLLLESYQTIMVISIITLCIVVLSLTIALYLTKIISTPLRKISDDLEAINSGVLDLKIHTTDIPELAKISDTINALVSSLQQSKEDMHVNIDQATADLTQTLETIEIQNIELDLARKQAIQASRVKSEFLANISHEIRTPMNGVIGFTNLLLNSNIDKTQKDYLQTIRKSANNLLSIIEDILDFSKIEAGKMTIDEVSYSLRDCVEEVISILSTSSIKKNIELIPLIYKNVPELLIGDPVRVRQILTNLISNAIKFTEKGSIVVRIVLEDENDGYQTIRTTITDTGIGMTDEQILKLFQPFSQVNKNIDRHHTGTGLGLVISKKLVEQMSGEITVESKSNEGTSFSFTLLSEKVGKKLIKKKRKESQISIPEQQVYIYDPHPMALLALKHLLSSYDLEVHDYQNINKLVEKLEQDDDNPLILLGVNHEGHYHSQLSKLLKLNLKALFILGNYNDKHNFKKYLDQNNTLFVEKPLTRKQLRKSFEDVGLITSHQTGLIQSDESNKQFPQLKILAVDDNPANLKLITIVLEEMAIDVTSAFDGLSSIEICKEEKFDLIFMDIRMPGLDGIDTSKRIRTDGANMRTPIIALTAHAMTNEKEKLMSHNLNDCITKPISTKQLEHVISRWTGQIAKPAKKVEGSRKNTKLDTIDWNACLDISGGREKLAIEMLNDLVTAIPEFKQLIINKTDDHQEMLSIVHKLHGFACYTGVPTLQMLTAKLETRLKDESSPDMIEPLQSKLITELTAVEQESVIFLTSNS